MKNIEEFHWILASGSPRRKELLEQIGIRPQIIPSGMEEVITSADPELVVMELSEQKAEDVAFSAPEGSIILGADTVVSVDGEILGKPSDHENACEMIRSIQGRTHQVYTGVTLIYKDQDCDRGATFVEKTDVKVNPMTEEEITAYGQSEEPMDKAGAYGIQGAFARYVASIQGNYDTVVGLPVSRVYREWKSLMEQEDEEE